MNTDQRHVICTSSSSHFMSKSCQGQLCNPRQGQVIISCQVLFIIPGHEAKDLFFIPRHGQFFIPRQGQYFVPQLGQFSIPRQGYDVF